MRGERQQGGRQKRGRKQGNERRSGRWRKCERLRQEVESKSRKMAKKFQHSEKLTKEASNKTHHRDD